ncbi:hypothetical protein WA026_015803 [Henosepilachna vigintioctopunctata]|uniref:Endonuclease/exonuclease/phosphatase domain-containing protein n=1 Tax=Henosepilachna vigintioctopunctata TaxID=420089 RepID=A0AAW1V1Y3_9CUCU
MYRSPTGHLDTFLSSLNSLFGVIGANRRIILAGDFNVHFGTDETASLQLCDMMAGFGMQQTIKEATRHNSCLDNVFVSANMNVDYTEVTDLNISDHLGQIVGVSVPSEGKGFYQIKKNSDQLLKGDYSCFMKVFLRKHGILLSVWIWMLMRSVRNFWIFWVRNMLNVFRKNNILCGQIAMLNGSVKNCEL